MIKFLLIGALVLLSLVFARAQQVDPSKIAPIYQAQRNQAIDGLAQCSIQINDLQARIAELEKKLAEAQK